MRRSFFSVVSVSNGDESLSRFFTTLAAARKWAKMLASRPYNDSAKIYRGQVGGELLEVFA
jgi:hypothetical protein